MNQSILRLILNDRNMGAETLAEQIGVSVDTLKGKVQDESKVTLQDILKMREVLQLDESETRCLFGLHSNPMSKS